MSDAIPQAWPEPVSIYLGRSFRFRVRFRVPGLRSDGTVKGENSVRRFVAKLPARALLFVADLLSILASMAVLLFWFGIQFVLDLIPGGFFEDAADSRDPDGWLRRCQRVIVVRADSPVADAVAAGRALARGRGGVWLVTSAHGTAVTQVVDGRQDVLWTGTGPDRPYFARTERELRWPDGSVVELRWPRRAG